MESIDRYIRPPKGGIQHLADDLIRNIDVFPTVLADRVRILLIWLTESGYLSDGDIYDDRLPEGDRIYSNRLLAATFLQSRNLPKVLESIQYLLSRVSLPNEIAEMRLKYARYLYENSELKKAKDWIELAAGVPDVSFEIGLLINIHKNIIFSKPIEDTFLRDVLGVPRSKFSARKRISILLIATEYTSKMGGIEKALPLSEEALKTSMDLDLKWQAFLAGMLLAQGYRNAGDFEKAMATLNTLPKFQLGTFNSGLLITGEKGFLFSHMGQFSAAHRDLSLAFNGLATSDVMQKTGLLMLRVAIWIFQQNFSAAREALNWAKPYSNSRKPILETILAIIEGDSDKVAHHHQILKDCWGNANHGLFSVSMHVINGVIGEQAEEIEVAQGLAFAAGPPVWAILEAGKWMLAPGLTAVPDWYENRNDDVIAPIFGSVVGIAIAGLLSHRIGTQTFKIIEPGLFLIDGKSVDLRRRKTLNRVLNLLYERKGEKIKTVELFKYGWERQTLTPNYDKSLYFSIFELRRLGLKNYIQKSGDGYYWEKKI